MGESVCGVRKDHQKRDIFVAIHSPRNFMDSTFLFSGEDREISDLLPCAYVATSFSLYFITDKTMQLTNTSCPQKYHISTLKKIIILVHERRFTCIYYNAPYFSSFSSLRMLLDWLKKVLMETLVQNYVEIIF